MEFCSGDRFVKHDERISKSKYRHIYRGYDNESGCEIAWSSYRLKDGGRHDKFKKKHLSVSILYLQRIKEDQN